jgi:aerobic-type carbon monoxide dehydrogenase small subunit (CoxS/CutS family)
MDAVDSFPEDPPRQEPNPGRRPHLYDPEDAVNPPHPIHCVINGRPLEVSAPPRRTLLQLLREDLHLTGTKEGCSIGTCGACTVLIDGRAVLSCLVLAVQANGRTVETIEAAARDSDPLLEAFIQHDAFQCGFCTPGQIMALRDLFRRHPQASAEEIRRAVEGNVCRCGAHLRIQAAAMAVAGSAGGRKGG